MSLQMHKKASRYDREAYTSVSEISYRLRAFGVSLLY
jgi:hypothetical protein